MKLNLQNREGSELRKKNGHNLAAFVKEVNRICAIVEFGTKLGGVGCSTTSTQWDF